MALCKLMQMAYKGTNPEHEGFDEYDLNYGIDYATGYLQEGYTFDVIGQFDMDDFLAWCERELAKRKGE